MIIIPIIIIIMPHFPQFLEYFVKVFIMFLTTFISPLITNYLWIHPTDGNNVYNNNNSELHSMELIFRN